MPLVDGGRTGGVVDGVNHLDRQPNGVRRGNAQRRTLVHTERAGGAHSVPDVTHCFRQESPASAEVGFGVAYVHLDYGLLAEQPGSKPRCLGPRQLIERGQAGAGHAQGHGSVTEANTRPA